MLEQPQVTFIGTATTVLRIGGFTVLTDPNFLHRGRRYPDIDAMLIHLGGTKVAGILLTMDAQQGADLVELIRPALTVPIHYDDYPVFRSPLAHFVEEARRRGWVKQVRVVARGETAPLTPP